MNKIIYTLVCGLLSLLLTNRSLSQDLYPAMFKGKWGYIDDKGSVKIAPTFNYSFPFIGETATVILNHVKTFVSKDGFVFPTGISSLQGENTLSFHEGLAAVTFRGKIAFINDKGIAVIPPIFSEVGIFSNGRAWAKKYSDIGDNKIGFIDKKGTFVISPQYTDAIAFSEGKAIVSKLIGSSVMVGVIDTNGKEVVPFIHAEIRPFTNGLAAFRRFSTGVSGWGFLDKNGNVTIEPSYEAVGDFDITYTWARSSNVFHLINKKGRRVLPIDFKYISAFENGYAKILEFSNKWSYIDSTGEYTSPYLQELVGEMSEGIYAIKKGDYWGYSTNKGKQITEYDFLTANPFKDGRALVSKDDKTFGYIDKIGNIVIPLKFTAASDFHNSIAQVSLSKDEWRYIDTNGAYIGTQAWSFAEKFVGNLGKVWRGHPAKGKYGFVSLDLSKYKHLAFKFENAKKFRENLAPVSVKKKWGYINKFGKWAIPPQFDRAELFYEGLASVKLNRTWRTISTNGSFVSKPYPDKILRYANGFAATRIGGKWGFVNRKGELAIPAKYSKVSNFKNGLALVSEDTEWILIDTNNISQVDRKYKFLSELEEGLAVASIDGYEFGFINAEGKVEIPFIYDVAFSFKQGMSLVSKNGKWGYINKQGQMVIKPKFLWGDSFSEGLATVLVDNNHWGAINKKGLYSIPPIFKKIEAFSEGLAATEDSLGQWGFINKRGKWVIKPIYLSVESFKNDYAKVTLPNKKKGYINRSGYFTIKPFFKTLDNISEGMALARFNTQWKKHRFGYMNKKGELVYSSWKKKH